MRWIVLSRQARRPAGVSVLRRCCCFFFSSRRRHTRLQGDWSSDVCSSDLTPITSPPNLLTHYYVLVAAPGSAGASLDVALESLNESLSPLRNKGVGFPPVHALDNTTLNDIDQSPIQNYDADIRPLSALRLSSNAADPTYNLYLSKPFLLTCE